MKTAGWSTRRVCPGGLPEGAVRNGRDSGHEKVPRCGKPGLERPGNHEEKGTCSKPLWTHSDSFNDTSGRRHSNCSTNNFQTPCRSKS
ncbi:hypothetical protein TNCV_823851 [Trichonephila clavipes]|nr:hypothetical protein TNCV_823851 [Trichonephila clavipes]